MTQAKMRSAQAAARFLKNFGYKNRDGHWTARNKGQFATIRSSAKIRRTDGQWIIMFDVDSVKYHADPFAILHRRAA